MWLESLDLVLGRLQQHVALGRIQAVGGACQQHGSVYWGPDAGHLLGVLDPAVSLADQLTSALSHPFAPNWQDHSTSEECDAFDAALGSPNALAQVTGSCAHHRFTGPQIMRLRLTLPQVYENTSRISLVSSFLASVLLGAIAPIDIADVCGMNLWDIPAHRWNDELLQLTAGSGGVSALRHMLGEVRQDGGGSLGRMSSYFVQKYGFCADCQITPFTGDNPATILGLPLLPLDAIVSLGTSTTFLMVTHRYVPHPSYHVFRHPTTPGLYMVMLCYKNGGVAREKIRDTLPKLTDVDPWVGFNKAIADTLPLDAQPGVGVAKLGLYFPLPEIVPRVGAGTWRFTSNQDGSGLQESLHGWPTEKDARAIVESQALSMRLRARSLLPHIPGPGLCPAQPRRIYLVGGGAGNATIARVVGDVLGGTDGVYRLDAQGNACALGGAYKALWAVQRQAGEAFEEFLGRRWSEDGTIQKYNDGYDPALFEIYSKILPSFEQMEQQLLRRERDAV